MLLMHTYTLYFFFTSDSVCDTARFAVVRTTDTAAYCARGSCVIDVRLVVQSFGCSELLEDPWKDSTLEVQLTWVV